MPSSTDEFLVEAEMQRRFIAAANDSWEHYEKTGLRIMLEEADFLLSALGRNLKSTVCKMHK